MTTQLRIQVVGTPDTTRSIHCHLYPDTEVTVDPEEIHVSRPGKPGETYEKKPWERLVLRISDNTTPWKS